MNIGIYGGSFNPVHFGHVNVARRAIEDLALDKLLVIPANVSPFKTIGAANASRFPWDRLEMVKNAFSAEPPAALPPGAEKGSLMTVTATFGMCLAGKRILVPSRAQVRSRACRIGGKVQSI